MKKSIRLGCLFALLMVSPSAAGADFERTKIAVLDFTIQGKGDDTEDMGAIVAEWLITAFVKEGRFDVIERRLLKKILGEQELGTTGVLDQDSVTQLGKLLGVKVVISGSVMRFQNVIEVNARIIDVESASIIAAESVKDTSAIGLEKLVVSMAQKIIKDFPLEGYIVHRKNDVVSIDLGKRLGVKRKMQFVAYKEGAVIKHPTTGEILDVETIETGALEIIKVGSKVSKAIIIREQSPNAIIYGQRVKSVGEPALRLSASRPKVSLPKAKPPKRTAPVVVKPEEKKVVAKVQPAVSVRPKPKVVGRDMGRYIAYDNGIVKDKRAGLEWIAGPDRDTTWEEAKNWVASLTVDGGGWRMPTKRDLERLYVERWGSRNMTRLIKTKGWYVWSGDRIDKGFDFTLSHEDWEYGQPDSSSRTRGFAVRSGK